MDCEKFETTMIDELYGELDEVTSAASKRHVAGCARCASLIGGLRATRRVVSDLPMAAPAEDLEDRILAAARNAQKVVPLKTRVARAVSRAGGWAMRPQTAMAAVFLVMIGMGTMFLRGRSAKEPASSVTVTDRGAPSVAGAAPAATTTAVALAETDEQAKAARAADKDRAPASPAPVDMPAASGRAYGAYGAATRANDGLDDQRISNAGPAAGAPAGQLPQTTGGGFDSLNAPAVAPTAAAQAAPAPAPAKAAAEGEVDSEKKTGGGGAAFDNAMAAYNAGRYDDAGKSFDTLAANDAYAALWAARAWRDGSLKCRGTVARFDTVAGRAAGTTVGYDALLDGATCYRLLGAYDAARDRLGRLLGVPSHEARARAELQKIAPQSNAKAAPKAASPTATTSPAAKQDTSYRQ